jgi:hypothetical protein
MPDPTAPQPDLPEPTGVNDVRLVREHIAIQYAGDLRKHIDETNRLVEPLIAELGLRESSPPKKNAPRSGAAG